MRSARFRGVGLLAVGLAMVGALGRSSPADAEAARAAAVQRPFIVFDATLYKDKPSFEGYPIRPIRVLYESRLFLNDRSPTAVPPEHTVRSAAKELGEPSEPVVVDIERWPVKGEARAVQATIEKFVSVLSWVKSEAPNVSVGIYGTVPIRDYWRAVRGPASKDYQAWQRENDRLDGIAAHVDVLFPSIYTFYPDRKGWVTYAIAQITEARRKAGGKPVYAFLWPQYHESNRLIGLQPIEPDYWELQLNTVYQHADGVVIWGGWGDKKPAPWDENAPWWRVTKRFMERHAPFSAPVPPGNLGVR
ncbi:MAG: hypothetical protein KF693_09975 [Nitrospira sp.]|nr:hypothetical protein [Nitrospira sp.]